MRRKPKINCTKSNDNQLKDFDELNLIHIILQVTGLAPYNIGSSNENTKLNPILVVYNIVIAILVLINTWHAENDEVNSGDYAYKTLIVNTAYELVDWIGSLYISTCVLLSIARYKSSSSLFFEEKRLHEKYKCIGVIFDKNKIRNYFIMKLIVTITVSIMYLSFNSFLEESTVNHYTVLYWICILHPVVLATIITIILGTYTLHFQNKLWVLNECIRELTVQYIEKKQRTPVLGLPTMLNSSKSLEEIPLEATRVQKVVLTSATKRHKPYYVFIKNFPDCFEKQDKNFLEKFKALKDLHFDVIEYSSLVNRTFGPHLLFIFVYSFFELIINCYAIITFHASGNINTEYISRVLFTLPYIIMVTTLTYLCDFVITEANQTTTTVYKFWTKISQDDNAFNRELQSFALQLANNPLEFTASGFFKVNLSTLFSFIGGIMTNVIFIVQFDKLNVQPTD